MWSALVRRTGEEMDSRDFGWRWHDQRYVDHYVRFTRGVRFDGAEWAKRLSVGRDSVVVDLGCGEGKLLIALGPYIARGIGFDVSTAAVAYARRNIEHAAVANVEALERDFRQLDLARGSVHAFVSIAALHHIPDDEKRAVLASVREALFPGGILHLEDDTFNFAPEQFPSMVPAMYREFEERFGSEAWAFLKHELAGEDFEFTPYLESLLSMMRSAGLDVTEVSKLGLNGAIIRAQRPPSE